MPTFPEGQTGVTLEAHWKPNLVNYTVEYYTEKLDGSYDMETETRQGNTDSTTNMTAQFKEGYTAKPIEQQTVAADGSTVVKVYYELNTYQVKFHDRFSETYEKTYRHGETITAPHVAKEGYTFAYWYSDYGTTHFVEGTAATESIDYYAEWVPITFTVDWIVDGKSIGTSTVQYGEAIRNWQRPNDHPTKAEDKTGTYEFTGWNTKEDGTGIQYDYNMRVKVGMTFYAQFKRTPAKYTVTWDANGGDALVMADTTTNGQTDYGTVIVPPADPTRAETAKATYDFLGWNTQTDGTGAALNTLTDNPDKVTADVTYYAQWRENIKSYKVMWDANGGNELSKTSEELPYGTAIVQPTTPTRDSTDTTAYTFTGWNTEKNGTGTAWTNSTTVTGHVTYYAQWKAENRVYSITYYSEGGEHSNPNTYTYGTAVTLQDAKRTGYTFDGWYMAGETDAGTKVTEISAMQTGDVILTAHWTAKTYTVNLNANGGTGGTESITVTYGQPMPSIPELPTNNTGLVTFGGFYDAERYGTRYYDENGTSVRMWDKDEDDVTLYARWNDNTKYPLFIADPDSGEMIQVTGSNRDDIFGDTENEHWISASFTYDPTTGGVLTLNQTYIRVAPHNYRDSIDSETPTNALNVNGEYVTAPIVWLGYSGFSSNSSDLTIKLVSSNSIHNLTRNNIELPTDATLVNCGIYAQKGDLTISVANGGYLDIDVMPDGTKAYGIYNGEGKIILEKGKITSSVMANKTSAAIYTKTNEVRIEENAKVIAGEATPYRLNEYGIEADKIYILGCLDAAGNTRALWLDGRFGNENIVQSLYMTYQGKKNESDEWGDFSTLYYKDYKYLHAFFRTSTQSAEAELPAVFADEEPVDVVSVTEAPDALPAKDEAVLTTEGPSIA